MKKTLKIAVIAFVVLVFVGTMFNFVNGKRPLSIKTLTGNEVTYRVERATTPKELATGLMYRKKLAPKTGMIFLFGKERLTNMWMKNTLIPLDMVFFDKKGTVTYVHKDAKPMDETLIPSFLPAFGVLEINAGETGKYNITVGSKLDLTQVQ